MNNLKYLAYFWGITVISNGIFFIYFVITGGDVSQVMPFITIGAGISVIWFMILLAIEVYKIK